MTSSEPMQSVVQADEARTYLFLLFLTTITVILTTYVAHQQHLEVLKYEAERVVKQREISQLKQLLVEKSQTVSSQEQVHSLHEDELKKLRLEYNELRRDCFSERSDPQGNTR